MIVPGRTRALFLGPDWLISLAEQAEGLLGDSLDRMRRRPGRQVRGAFTGHRLLRLIEAARRSGLLWGVKGAEPTDEDLVAVTELVAFVENAERWRADPAWESVRRSLVDPGSYLHNLFQLGIASHYLDAGNRVGLVGVGSARTPDAWVGPSGNPDPAARVWVEVKAPRELDHPQRPLDEAGARMIIDRSFRKRRRQLAPSELAMLVVGGIHVSVHDLRLLQHAADRHFHRTPPAAHRNMVGVAIHTVSPQLESVAQFAASLKRLQRLTAPTVTELVRNPHYLGVVQIEQV